MPNYPDQLHPGSFVPTTFIWDIARLNEIDVTSSEFKELLVRLYQNINDIALSLNTRDSGFYTLQENINGQLLFKDPALTAVTPTNPEFRQIFRKVINFGTLPNTGTRTVAHNILIQQQYQFTRIYGCATDPVNQIYIPLPYADPTAANNISLQVTSTTISITTGNNRSAFTDCVIIVEYVKQ